MTKVFLFPGQGSQMKGMGAELFEEFPDLVSAADNVLGYSIKQVCLEGGPRLSQTQYTQPAIYTVSALAYLKKTRQPGSRPDIVAGHSLGEYTALFAAGAFDFTTGLELVKRRGELMGLAKGGGMASVIGLPVSDVETVLRSNGLQRIDIANLNTPLQTVLSGPSEDIRAAESIFTKAGATMYMILNVSGAFHSRYMDEVRLAFKPLLQQLSFKLLQIPVIANWTARKYSDLLIRENLANQITGPVRWVETIEYLTSLPDPVIEEIGPGSTLTNMLKYFNKPSVTPVRSGTVAQQASIEAGARISVN